MFSHCFYFFHFASFYCLITPQVYITCFNQIDPQSLLFSSFPISMCFDAKVTESTQCCLHRCGGRISTGARVSSLGSHPWESDSCSTSSHQLPVASQTGVGLLLPCWSLADLILEKSSVCSQSCCDIAVRLRKYCLTTDAHCLWLLQSSYTLFYDDPWALRGGSVV